MRLRKLHVWKDETKSYSDKTIKESIVYFTQYERLTIHRHIGYAPDMWLASGVEITQRELKSKNLDEAKVEALEIVKKIVESRLCSIDIVSKQAMPTQDNEGEQ